MTPKRMASMGLWVAAAVGRCPARAGAPDANAAMPVGAVARFDLVGRTEHARPTFLWGGSVLEAHVRGRGGAAVTWALAYEQTVLSRGGRTLDKGGTGRLRLTMPAVRHRAICELVLASADRTARRKVVVYPARPLSYAAGRVAELKVGVLDATGRAQEALRRLGVPFTSLDAQIARDFLEPDVVIAAGFDQAAMLRRACRRFRQRVRAGACLVVLNPPEGWKLAGVEAVRSDKPHRGAVRFADGIGRFVAAPDLGEGPWPRTLRIDANAMSLAWSKGPAPAGAGATRPASRRADLVVVRQVGKGRAIVSALPQTARPHVDVIGQGVLGELILWLIASGPPGRPQNKEINRAQSQPANVVGRHRDGTGG